MRFYRFNLSTSADYEAMRAAVDAALGYSGGVTCIQPYASAPQDAKGRVLLSINPSTPGYSLLVLELAGLIAASKVRELDQNWYEFSLEPIVTGGGGGGSSAWGDITGTPTTLAGYGITDAVASSDSRLTDSRAPTSHKATHAAGGADALSPTDIGASAACIEEEFTVGAGASGYTGSGTSGSPYTRTSGVPAGAKMVVIQAHAAGGGGGGGYRRASGAAGAGGGGGGAGAQCVRFADVAGLDGQTVTVQVGAGGAGGAGGDGANATAGSAGTGGGDTLVRIGTTPRYWLCVGGNGGGGGTASTGTAGTAGGNTEFGGVNGSASSVTAAPANVAPSGPNCAGGGAGGGCSAANAQFAGGFVNAPRAPLLVFGNDTANTNTGNASAGTAGGGAGGSGGAGCGGGGGGGNATGAGGAGASGGDYGGGGGGGGCGTGAAGGSGGNGAPGFVRIAWIF